MIEMLITVSIGLLVSAGIATVFVFAMQQMNLLIEKNQTEQTSLWATYYLQKYLSQAVNVYAVSGFDPADTITIDATHNTTTCPIGFPSPANAPACGYGQFIYDFDAQDALNPATGGGGPVAQVAPGFGGNYYALAVFNREIGNPESLGVLPGSNMMPTGIFIREPTVLEADAVDTLVDDRSYILLFNSTTSAGVLPTPLVASTSALQYSRMHNLRVQRIACQGLPGGYNVEVVRDSDATLFTCIPATGLAALPPLVPRDKFWVKTATFEVDFRYFKGIDRTAWDYFFDGGGPGAGAPAYPVTVPVANLPAYRDIQQTIKVNFNNNTLTSQSLTGGAGIPERAGGPLYFFDSYVPMANAWGF